jgi:hypothetical protein
MEVTSITNTSSPSVFTHSDIVMGVVDNQFELDMIVASMSQLGVTEVETLEGELGAAFLRNRESSLMGLVQYYLGDMETETRKTYSYQVSIGHLIFAVPVTAINQDLVIKAVQELFATHIVHFGNFVNQSIPSLQKPILA